MTFRTLEEFLAARLGFARPVIIDSWVGISSDAMVREAIDKTPVHVSDYPHDLGDLSRCCATFAAAPWALKSIMLPRLTAYCEYGMNGWRTLEPAPKPEPTPEPRILGLVERFTKRFS